VKLQKAVSVIVNWRLDRTLNETRDVFRLAKFSVTLCVSTRSLLSIDWWVTELTKIGAILPSYFITIAFLHLVHRISRNCFSDDG